LPIIRLFLYFSFPLFFSTNLAAEVDKTAPPHPARPAESIIAQIQQARANKDSLLRHDPHSPIPADLRSTFKGLDYFPIDLQFFLIGDLHIYGRRRQIQVPATDGDFMPMERFGRFVAHLGEKPFWLEVYRSLEDNSLTILFTDKTNGKETYSGGRYTHLSNLGNGQYLLDFNESYNPYCAYNADYICPMPPAQNRLPLAIRAGEKAFGADLAH